MKDTNHDTLSVNLQETIIGMAQRKLQKQLPNDLLENIRNRGWSYMGLEMISDTIKTLEGDDLEEYLRNL